MCSCNFSEATMVDASALMKIETNALHTKKLAFPRRDMLVRMYKLLMFVVRTYMCIDISLQHIF